MKTLHALFSTVRFSSGRRISVYNQLRSVAEKLKLPLLLQHIERARDHDVQTRALEDRWAAQTSRSTYPVEVSEIDNVADPVLTSIRDIAEGHVAGLPEEHPLREEVDNFLDRIFPAGVSAITSLAYVDQVAAMENIVAALQGELRSTVTKLGLESRVQYLADLTVEYRQGVDQGAEPMDFATVREARERGHQYLLEIISIIVGTYYDSDNPAHVEARAELLGPILAHEKIVRAGYRRRSSRAEEPAPAGDIDSASEAASGARDLGEAGSGDAGTAGAAGAAHA